MIQAAPFLFFASYLACGGGALWLSKRQRQGDTVENRATRHGNSGEQRVAQLLGKAGYAVITDITLKAGRGTHQIDHIVCGQDRLFVLETKTWRGKVEGGPREQNWRLIRPRSREPITAYNPLLQNQTHAEVIKAICRVPVTPLVVSAGFLQVPPELAAYVHPVASLPAVLGPATPPAGRIGAAFNALAARKAARGQAQLSAAHKYWMIHKNRLDPVRALWVGSVLSLVCAMVATHHMLGS